jgi:hypothetical protein
MRLAGPGLIAHRHAAVEAAVKDDNCGGVSAMQRRLGVGNVLGDELVAQCRRGLRWPARGGRTAAATSRPG